MTKTTRRLPASALARAAGLTLLTFLLVPIGGASAATTVTRLPAAHETALVGGSPATPPAVALVGHTLIRFIPGTPGATTRAGRQSVGVQGISGSTGALPACGRSPCTDRYRGAGTPALRNGHWGVEVQLVVTQPSARLGVASGFALQVAVLTRAGWVTSVGYLSTGTNPSTVSRIIDLDFFVDLGVTTRPTLLTTDIVLSACASALVCR